MIPLRPTRQLAAGLLLVLAAPSVRAAHEWFVPEPPYLTLGAGIAEIFDRNLEGYGAIEYRPAARFFHLGPWFFFGSGKGGAVYAAGGVLFNLHLGRGWFLTPSFGPGYYDDGGHFDLGFELEFRTGIELSRQFRNRHRLAVGLAHLSNGSLSDRNPGTETLHICWSIPLGQAPVVP
ncbi:MAG: acyloxyacyl hydrolase [Lentisphaerae bacterium]|nr:acyloxyacyl hydrolase [Lentisphaerota bacterium]